MDVPPTSTSYLLERTHAVSTFPSRVVPLVKGVVMGKQKCQCSVVSLTYLGVHVGIELQ